MYVLGFYYYNKIDFMKMALLLSIVLINLAIFLNNNEFVEALVTVLC
jgi:hypothetical protein